MARTKQFACPSTVAIAISNVTPNETIHQRALLLKGHITLPLSLPNTYLSPIRIRTTSQSDDDSPATFPEQTWPVQYGHFIALVLLTPGANHLHLRWEDDHYSATRTLTVTYIPLLQTPPLHLAIMVASDSPLLTDCPAHKHAGLSSAHVSLDAAVAKLRMAAYMWQAATAEDMRAKGLGRRSFRLEEEWGVDTLSSTFLSTVHEPVPPDDEGSPYRSSAKVHLVRADRTVAELRSPSAEAELRSLFLTGLRKSGGPFAAGIPEVAVAGLVLDSHYSAAQDRVLANPGPILSIDEDKSAISLGAFGSHTCWAWPRFVEEVASCLLDSAPCSDYGVDTGQTHEHLSARECCYAGQARMLREVDAAFAGAHRDATSVVAVKRDWAAAWLTRFELREHHPDMPPSEGLWSLREALDLRCRPHFRLPEDKAEVVNKLAQSGRPDISGRFVDGDMRLKVSAEGGLAWVTIRGVQEYRPSVAEPVQRKEFEYKWLEARYGREEALEVSAVAMNGKVWTVPNVWALFGRMSLVKVPGSDVVLEKTSVKSDNVERYDQGHREGREYWEWAAMLTQRGVDGKLTHANAFDMRVGGLLDGGVLYYDDGHKTHLGPRVNEHEYGNEHEFGGASHQITLSPGNDIVKVEVHRSGQILIGLRTTLADGTVGGELHEGWGPESDIFAIDPGPDDRVVGFFGRSRWNSGINGIEEFGIILAPKGVELPESVYELAELKNTDGGLEEVKRVLGRGGSRKRPWNGDDNEDACDEEWEDGRP